MTRTTLSYQWRDRVASRFPGLSAAQRAWLAAASLGMALAGSGLLNKVALALSARLGATFNAVRQRLRHHYKDGHFDPAACFGPLLAWATAGFTRKRLALALDPTSIGGRFTVLTASVVFRGGAVPVAWEVRRADQKGSWNEAWARLLGALKAGLGPGWTVYVLTDRGLESKTLFESIAALGWHPLMRVKEAGHFKPARWKRGWPMGRFAAGDGASWKGRGTAWPGGDSRLGCTLLARRDAGREGPWLVLTDLPPSKASAAWYGARSWIEAGFRDLKSDGWDLGKTRMADPDRVGRWWAAAALATLHAMEAGQQAERLEVPAARTHAGPGQPPVTSLFALGLAWLGEQLRGGRLRRRPPLAQPKWVDDTRPSDRLREPKWIKEKLTNLPL